MPSGPSRYGRKTPLPGRQLHVVKDTADRIRDRKHRAEDRHVGVETTTVRVMPALHPACLAYYYDEKHGWVCPTCAWRLGLATANAAYAEFWLDNEDDER